jgi:hypothetical protein
VGDFEVAGFTINGLSGTAGVFKATGLSETAGLFDADGLLWQPAKIVIEPRATSNMKMTPLL